MLLEPFQYPFIQRALLAGAAIGITGACVGTFVVLRRMSLVGHALSHSALPGLVIAYLCGASLLMGGLGAALITAVVIGWLSKNEELSEDTLLGVVPTVMFALGILLMSTHQSFRDLSAMLFGNILAVTSADLQMIAAVLLLTLGALACFYKELKLFCVDPHYARAIGIPVALLRYGLLVFLALIVVVGIQAVGTVLTNALLVLPVAAARLLTTRLGRMMALASFFAVLAAVGGVLASYYWSLSSGASIVAACGVIFVAAWVYRRLI